MRIRLVGLHTGLLFKNRDAGMAFLPVLPCRMVVFGGIGDRLVINILPIEERHGILDVVQTTGNRFQVIQTFLVRRDIISRH